MLSSLSFCLVVGRVLGFAREKPSSPRASQQRCALTCTLINTIQRFAESPRNKIQNTKNKKQKTSQSIVLVPHYFHVLHVLLQCLYHAILNTHTYVGPCIFRRKACFFCSCHAIYQVRWGYTGGLDGRRSRTRVKGIESRGVRGG